MGPVEKCLLCMHDDGLVTYSMHVMWRDVFGAVFVLLLLQDVVKVLLLLQLVRMSGGNVGTEGARWDAVLH